MTVDQYYNEKKLDTIVFIVLLVSLLKIMSSDTLALTNDNVEKVLDELRPFLISDGGNVEIAEIDGPIVKVRLQGACGSCPSSTMTLKMGIERKLKEMIPEISEVVQVL